MVMLLCHPDKGRDGTFFWTYFCPVNKQSESLLTHKNSTTMRLFLFSLLFLTFGSAAQAQVFVNKVNINNRNIEYLEIWEKFDQGKKRYVALVDYGQVDDRRQDKNGDLLRVTNKEGVALEFNSIVHILNYMHRNGWEVLSVNSMGEFESYLMKRDHPEEFQISGSDN